MDYSDKRNFDVEMIRLNPHSGLRLASTKDPVRNKERARVLGRGV
jgi:hypothetical protein